jgi:hypothetical protein
VCQDDFCYRTDVEDINENNVNTKEYLSDIKYDEYIMKDQVNSKLNYYKNYYA